MDADIFKAIYGDALKNVTSQQELDEQMEEQRLAQEAAAQALTDADEKKKKDENDKKGLLQKVGEGLGELGKNVGAGVQQTVGKVADVALEGGALVDEAANLMSGGSEQEKDQRRIENLKGTDKLRELLHSQKDIKGENIGGAQKADAAAEKINAGTATVRDAATLAGESLDVGLGATMFANPTSLLAGGGKATAKEVLKVAGKDAALFGGADAASATASTYGETGDVAKSLETGAKTGLLSAVTQGGLDIGGAALGRAISGPGKKVDDVVEPTVKTDNAPTVEESTTQFSKIDDDELAKQIEQFQSGERTANTEADYARYQELKDEAQFRVDQKDKQDFEGNGLPNTPEEAQKALEAFDAGDMPDTAFKPRKAEIKSVAEIFADDQIPPQIRSAAQEVMDDQGKVNTMLDGLMNDKKYESSHREMDQAYNARLREISTYPEPRQIAEREKLDTQYKDDLAELEMLRTKDLPEVEQYNEMADMLEQREQQVVADTNLLIENNPDTFRVPDEAEVAAQRQPLVDNLEQAKRFNEPSRVVEQVANASDPVKAYDRNPDAQVAMKKEVTDQVDAIPNTDVVEKNFKSTGTAYAILRAMSPSQVLEKMGLRGKDIDLHSNILKAESAVNRANKADSKVLSEIATLIPNNKQAQKAIIEYIEGSRKTLDLGDQKAAETVKAFLDEKRAGLEKLGFKTLDEYFPHIFDMKDPEVIRLFKGKQSGEINFGNLKSRLSESDDYSRDIMDVLTTYTSGYNRKVYLEPAIKPLADLRKQVELSGAEAKWADDYVKQLTGLDTSTIGDAYNQMMDKVFKKVGIEGAVGKNHYTATLGTQRMISAAATMGLNPGTAIRNLTQMVNTVAEIGPVHATTGALDGLRLLGTKAGRAELQRVGILEGGVSQNYFDAITKPGVRGRIAKGRDNSVKGLMAMIHMTDVSLRAQAYAGAKSLAAAKGMTGEAAENFAIRKVVDSQFITSRVDMPLAFSGQGVRSLTQLATFSGKQAGFLKRMGVKMVKGADGEGFRMADAGAVLSAVLAAGVATEALKPLLGFRETEWVPFYDQIAPLAGAITGEEVQGGDSLYRSPLVRLLAGDGKSKTGLIQAIQDGGDMQAFWEDNWSQLVPAGTQIKKSTEGYETTTTGESRNSSGKIRYLQNTDPDSVLNASIFGQYSTENGRNWIKEGFPTLSESQTEKVDAQSSRSVKEQYADFYTAIKKADGRQDAYDEVKAAALTGNQTRAAQAAQAYNQKLIDAEAEYRSKHDELPQKLQDELDGMRINVSKITNNTKD